MILTSVVRIEDTIVKLKIQQEDKLQKWHEDLGDISGWVMKTRVKVDAQVTLASDVDGALEQIDDFQVSGSTNIDFLVGEMF